MLRVLIIWPVFILVFCPEDIRAQRDELPVHQITTHFQHLSSMSGAGQLKQSLLIADSLDAQIPLLLLHINLQEAHEALQAFEKQLMMLRNSMGYLHQNMAFQKKVAHLSEKGQIYRSQLFELALKHGESVRKNLPNPVLVPVFVVAEPSSNEALASRVAALERDTARLSLELKEQIQLNDSLDERNHELEDYFKRLQEPIFIGISIGITIARNRHLRGVRAVLLDEQ